MKTIVICSYREWSENISDYLLSEFDKLAKFIKIKNKDEFNQLIKDETKVDLFLFIGWSEIISKNIVDKNMCFCLHPSLLPKYRGGSPLQNQIIKIKIKLVKTNKFVISLIFQLFSRLSALHDSVGNLRHYL